jgi:hypothetical protein
MDMDKIDLGVDKDDLRYIFRKLLESGKISRREYDRALAKVAAIRMDEKVRV